MRVNAGIIDPELTQGVMTKGYNAYIDRGNALANQERANKLADLQYQQAMDTETQRRALQSFRANKNPQDKDYYAGLRMLNPALALEEESKQATINKTRAEAEGKEFELQSKKLDFTLQAVGASPTPEKAISYITQGLKNGVFSMQEASDEIAELRNITPEGYAQYRMNALQRTLQAKDQLDMVAPKIDQMDTGSSFVATQANRYQPGYGRPVQGMAPTPKTATIGERTAQGNLSLAQQKFAFEQANPGITVQQTEDGTLVGVNNRTGVAMPITMGGAAPMAPAAVPASNAFSPRLPPTAAPAVTQAIPGMPSVLDQRAPVAPVAAAPAVPMAGTPLRGKGTAMTDTQHNAALFGGAMAQAQSTIQQIEKTGTNKSVAVVPGLLTGLANMAPFGAGEGIANAIDATFRADPTRLLGPDADQQRLAQAQLAFATAYLRKTSGAAFGASEVANTIKEFFPLRGEPDAVVQQKAASRERVVKGMSMGTTAEGRKHIEEAAGSNDPLGIRKPQ